MSKGNRDFLLFFLLTCTLFFPTTPLNAAIFQVTNNSGNNGVAGSFPWALEQAVNSAGADRIIFTKDVTIKPVGGERIFYFDDSGLTIDNNGHSVIIDGSLMTGDPTWPLVGIWLGDTRDHGSWGRLAQDVIISGITIQNCANGGILVEQGASDITIESCTFINNGSEGLRIDGSTLSSDNLQEVTGIKINGCKSYNNNGNGIVITQSPNYASLTSNMFANLPAGSWSTSGSTSTTTLENFINSSGKGPVALTYFTNPRTNGTVVENIGNIGAIILTGANNQITNSGDAGFIVGGYNERKNSHGGSNTINNYGTAGIVVGSYNEGVGSSGGSNIITNSGIILGSIIGSWNQGAGSTSSGNIITNTGYVGRDIWGSWNSGTNSKGGNDTIINYGTVAGSIYGEDGNDSISNNGTVAGSIYGGTGNDSISNYGTVAGSIYGGSGNDTITLYNGSSIGGIADGGSGTDTLILRNIGWVKPSAYIGFENLDIYGTYGVALRADGGNSPLRVSNKVSIHGGTLKVSLPRALYANGRNWDIIKTYGTINGTFSSISTNFNSQTIKLQQTIKNGTLAVEIKRKPYTSFGTTSNQASTGSALDTLLPSLQYGTNSTLTANTTSKGALKSARAISHTNMTNLLLSMDFDMTRPQLEATLSGLNPEAYTAFPASGLEIARLFTHSVNRRQLAQRSSIAFPSPDNQEPLWNTWFQVLGGNMDQDTDKGISGYNLKTNAIVLGMDRNINTSINAGLLVGFSDSDLSQNDTSSSGQINSSHFGLYGHFIEGGFFLDATAGYTILGNSSEREITTPLFSATGVSSFDGQVWNGALTVGYDFLFDSIQLEPLASLAYMSLDQDGLNESGASTFSVVIEDDSFESLFSRIGLNLTGLVETDSWKFLPKSGINWMHQFKDDEVVLHSSFTDYPTASFTISGAEIASDQLMMTLGISAEYGQHLTMYIDYSINASNQNTSHLLSCGLSWLF